MGSKSRTERLDRGRCGKGIEILSIEQTSVGFNKFLDLICLCVGEQMFRVLLVVELVHLKADATDKHKTQHT